MSLKNKAAGIPAALFFNYKFSFIALNDSSLITCSILQASLDAVSAETPSFIKYSVITLCLAKFCNKKDSNLSKKTIYPEVQHPNCGVFLFVKKIKE